MGISKFLIGLMVVTVIMGGPEQMMMMIVCTAGMSLIAIIPLSYVIGSIIFKVVFIIFGVKEEEKSKKQLSNKAKTLKAFIERKLVEGEERTEITSELLLHGWSPEIIDEAYGALEEEYK